MSNVGGVRELATKLSRLIPFCPCRVDPDWSSQHQQQPLQLRCCLFAHLACGSRLCKYGVEVHHMVLLTVETFSAATPYLYVSPFLPDVPGTAIIVSRKKPQGNVRRKLRSTADQSRSTSFDDRTSHSSLFQLTGLLAASCVRSSLSSEPVASNPPRRRSLIMHANPPKTIGSPGRTANK